MEEMMEEKVLKIGKMFGIHKHSLDASYETFLRCHYIQNNNTQHIDTQRNKTFNTTQHNDTQRNCKVLLC